MSIINEKQNEVVETVNKIKASLDEDIYRARFKLNNENILCNSSNGQRSY